MSPVEHTALDMALTDAVAANSTPTLPMVLQYLLNPTPATVALVGRDGGTGVGHSLRRTVAGDLEGMFDAPRPLPLMRTRPSWSWTPRR
ncbi:hypothetical protein NHF46_00805 [Arthrobacter alpinus]|nr:hypothetical protein [Arthrobacter alpinus]